MTEEFLWDDIENLQISDTLFNTKAFQIDEGLKQLGEKVKKIIAIMMITLFSTSAMSCNKTSTKNTSASTNKGEILVNQAERIGKNI